MEGLREAKKKKMARTEDGKAWEIKKGQRVAGWEVREEGEGSYTEPEDLEARGGNDSQAP